MLQSAVSSVVPLASNTRTVHTTQRFVVIDMLRGIAMLLMALDHSSWFARFDVTAETYNGVRPTLGSWPHVVTPA